MHMFFKKYLLSRNLSEEHIVLIPVNLHIILEANITRQTADWHIHPRRSAWPSTSYNFREAK